MTITHHAPASAKRQTLYNIHIKQYTRRIMTTNSQSTDRTEERARTKRLTKKQKMYSDILLNNPDVTGTQAAQLTYNVKNKETAAVISSENLNKPNIQMYLEKHADKALSDNIEIAEYAKHFGREGTKEGASYASVATSINKDILDRTYGKARQQVDVNSTAVTLTIDLTSALALSDSTE